MSHGTENGQENDDWSPRERKALEMILAEQRNPTKLNPDTWNKIVARLPKTRGSAEVIPLKPNPLPENPPARPNNWPRLFSIAASLLVVGVLLWLYPHSPFSPDQTESGEIKSITQSIAVTDPYAVAQELQKKLTQLGIEAQLTPHHALPNGWLLTATNLTETPALNALLREYTGKRTPSNGQLEVLFEPTQ
ncbi:hypothetical protein [Thioflexithrix psekupsensis]|uniref:Uncharacterized protein n=1 Tax=Thioflexithrix psekupsensis TaxID=1570016 RepID=A0A251X7V2_9GAMM|nr:hypothetical protein [Thioflexithrix psekupsensis]OUD14015.1 hypothetical protein TPSD3_06640 [Thioflexithrix psekupsensis]